MARTKRDDIDLAAAARRAESGEAISALAMELGCDRKWLGQSLRQLTGASFTRRITADVESIEAQLAEGRTLASIAADMGVYPASLSAWLKRKTGRDRQFRLLEPKVLVAAATGRLDEVAGLAGVSKSTLRRRLAGLDRLSERLGLPLCLDGDRVYIDLPFQQLLKRLIKTPRHHSSRRSSRTSVNTERDGHLTSVCSCSAQPSAGDSPRSSAVAEILRHGQNGHSH